MNQAVDPAKLDELLGRVVGDLGAVMSAALVVVGDKLGLYKGLAAGGAQTPSELAQRTQMHERYIREWLCAQAAGGYVTYDAASVRFSLTPEQAAALGAQAGEARLRAVAVEGGFTRFRRASATPFNSVFEARP